MANLKYYNEATSEWETLVIGKQGPSGIANATAPVTYNGGTQTVGLTDAFIGQTVRTYANASARATAIPSPTEGMMTYLNDTDQIEVWSGSGWVRRVSTSLPFAQAAGTSSADGSSVTFITFPVLRFTVGPYVTLAQNYVSASGAGSSVFVYIPYLYIPSSTGFGIIMSGATGAIGVYWHAIQMTSSTAGG